ncbi:hypothetical protein ACFL6S_17310 [Candidatus Poribacteria bacterium]
MLRIPIIAIAMFLCLSPSINAATLFEDDFSNGLDNWTLNPGGGAIEIIEDKPPEYGTEVLSLSIVPDINIMAFVKDLNFTDGYIEMLWKDDALGDGLDADGTLVARDQVGDFRDCYMVELDEDTGVHIAIKTNDAENVPGHSCRHQDQ